MDCHRYKTIFCIISFSLSLYLSPPHSRSSTILMPILARNGDILSSLSYFISKHVLCECENQCFSSLIENEEQEQEQERRLPTYFTVPFYILFQFSTYFL